MAEATRRYMLTVIVRLAALHCSTGKRRLQLAVRAHAGVTVGDPQKGQPAYADTLMLDCVRPAGLPRETFTFPLVCTVGKGRQITT